MTIYKLEHVIVVVLEEGAFGHPHMHDKHSIAVLARDLAGATTVVQQLPTSHTYSHITRTLTEEEMIAEVETINDYQDLYKNYNPDPKAKYVIWAYKSAELSFLSLLRSLSIPTDNLVFVHIDNMKK